MQQPHEVDDMESEEGGSIVAWEASTELSESKPPQESRLDGPEGPAASEEPHVRGSRRCWLDKPLERVNPLRKEMAHEKSSVAKKSLASTGSFSLYGNKAFQEVQACRLA